MNQNGANVITPADGTSRAVRHPETWTPPSLIGADIPFQFLCQHLLDRNTSPDGNRLLPNKQTVMLYGR
jgi:hypothetical protein